MDSYELAAYLIIALIILALAAVFVAVVYWAVGEAFGYLLGRYPNPWQRLALAVLTALALLALWGRGGCTCVEEQGHQGW